VSGFERLLFLEKLSKRNEIEGAKKEPRMKILVWRGPQEGDINKEKKGSYLTIKR